MAKKKVALIGVPMDLGASKSGCAGGPEAIRRTNVAEGLSALGFDVRDLGDLKVPSRSKTKAGDPKLKSAAAIAEVCEALAAKVKGALRDGMLPVTLGGDHSLAMGSVAGSAAFHKKKGELGLIWVDAHGDINTSKTSHSGNVHGMPLAALLGSGDKRLTSIGGAAPKVRAEKSVLVGVRDLDEGERGQIKRLGVGCFTMKEVDIQGMAAVASQAIERASEGTAGIHLSFDIDVVDPSIAQGVGTPSRGGLNYREAHLLMELIADSGRLVSIDMVEINPLEDTHNATAALANELVQSALGKRIY